MPAWFCPAISHSGGTVPGDPFPPHGLSPWNWPETISSTSTANRQATPWFSLVTLLFH